MTDVFQEVDEKIREERARALFRQYAPFGAAVLAAIVVFVGGREMTMSRAESRGQESARQLLAAENFMEAGDAAAAQTALTALVDDGVGDYPYLARVKQAELALEAGDAERAATLFETAAGETSDPLLQDLALLKSAYAIADTVTADELEVRLSGVSAGGRPLQTPATELVAASALRDGDLDKADGLYGFISLAPDTPQAARQRAQEALAVIAALRAVEDDTTAPDAADADAAGASTPDDAADAAPDDDTTSADDAAGTDAASDPASGDDEDGE